MQVKDWSPHRHHWDLFLHLSMAYRGHIKFSREFEKNVEKHVEYLQEREKRVGA